jgi:hypothetical protein
MGCDIHLYKEKLVNGKWLTADEWETDDDGHKSVPWKKRFTDRNYNLFGLLCKGVRSDHEFSFDPRGIPFDACEEIKDESESWASDEHSHSYLYVSELKRMDEYLKSVTIKVSGMKHKDELQKLRETAASENPNWDLLYPYCGWASSSEYEEFTLDVPASFIVGGSLQKIIESFDGVEGDDHRIVFFFDN